MYPKTRYYSCHFCDYVFVGTDRKGAPFCSSICEKDWIKHKKVYYGNIVRPERKTVCGNCGAKTDEAFCSYKCKNVRQNHKMKFIRRLRVKDGVCSRCGVRALESETLCKNCLEKVKKYKVKYNENLSSEEGQSHS